MKKIHVRIIYLITTITITLLGLTSRIYGHLLPDFIAENAGDTLWAMMVYFGSRFLFVQKGALFAELFSFLFCFCVEFSQLYQTDWINQIRGTLIGALVLGHGFLVIDLVRYTVGIISAAILDWFLNRCIGDHDHYKNTPL